MIVNTQLEISINYALDYLLLLARSVDLDGKFNYPFLSGASYRHAKSACYISPRSHKASCPNPSCEETGLSGVFFGRIGLSHRIRLDDHPITRCQSMSSKPIYLPYIWFRGSHSSLPHQYLVSKNSSPSFPYPSIYFPLTHPLSLSIP